LLENFGVGNNSLENEMKTSPEKFDGEIIEMCFKENKWYPYSHRKDKIFPNKYITGLTNDGLLYLNNDKNKKNSTNKCDDKCTNTFSNKCDDTFSNKFDDKCINKFADKCHDKCDDICIDTFSNKFSNKSNNLNEIFPYITQYIFETLSNIYPISSVLVSFEDFRQDTCLTIYNITSPSEIYCVHSSREVIVQVVENLALKPPLTKIFFNNTVRKNVLDLNIINMDLDNPLLIDELNKCYHFIENSIDTVVIELTAYKLNSISKMLNFRKLCSKILSPNGIIIIFHYNLPDKYTEKDETDYLKECNLKEYSFSIQQSIEKFLREPHYKFGCHIGNISFLKKIFSVVDEIVPFENQTIKDYIHNKNFENELLKYYTVNILKL
jgi:hypothetical protein